MIKGDRRGNERGNLAQAFIRALFVDDDALQTALPHHIHLLMGKVGQQSLLLVYTAMSITVWVPHGTNTYDNLLVPFCHFQRFFT